MGRGLSRQQACRLMLVTSAAALTAACSGDPGATGSGVSRPAFSEDEYGVSTSPRVATRDIPKGGGTFKVGSPYKVADRWYVPRHDPNYEADGIASWYGSDFHGRRTANGEVFDANALTAAHPTLPLPCYAYVTNLDNGRAVLVRVNDRGPYVNDRLIDMSYAAAKELGFTAQGRARVHVQFAGLAPLNGDDSRERQFLASQQERGDTSPPVMLASARSEEAPSYRNAPLPPDASDKWSPIAYRAALAGKAAPVPAPQLAQRPRTDIAMGNTAPFNDGRMSLTAPPSPAVVPTRFAPASQTFAQTFEGGRTFVQVGIFRDRSNAERLRHELAGLGPIEVAPMQIDDGGEVYRVRVGPFSPAAASQAQDQVAAYGVSDSAIVTD